MSKHLGFLRGQTLADSQHHVARIVPTLGHAPQPQLFVKVGRRLSGERRVGGTNALPLRAVTGGAGDNAAFGRACMIECQLFTRHGVAPRIDRHCPIIVRYRTPLAIIQLPRDPRHLRMVAPTIGIGFELALQITGVEAGKARCTGPVAVASEAMAGDAGSAGACVRAAQRNHLAIGREAVLRCGIDRASSKQDGRQRKDRAEHADATVCRPRGFRLAMLLSLISLAACKPPPDQRQFMPQADAANGRAVIERVGCGSCHSIPGIGWPRGKAGPALDGLPARAMIGGALPNRPDVLAAYIRNAPALVPGSGMPAMPVSGEEARDIAAYLYEQGAE